MTDKSKFTKTAPNCGCLVEDLIDTKKPNSRLCEVKPNDIEVFIDPDPEKTSYDFTPVE
jgi:hypothetical protein